MSVLLTQRQIDALGALLPPSSAAAGAIVLLDDREVGRELARLAREAGRERRPALSGRPRRR